MKQRAYGIGKAILFISFETCFYAPIYAQRIMNIEKENGTLISILTDSIKQVFFEKALFPDSQHPHIIDLGIGAKWACCNVGASSPGECGDYYAWGETSVKSNYDWPTYVYCDGTYDTCHHIGDNISNSSYDVAKQEWGNSWRMPNLEECEALVNCPSEWTSVNGVSGRIFTGPNGNCLFLPAAGYMWLGKLCSYNGWGLYWLGNLSSEYEWSACSIGFYRGDANWTTNGRLNGFPIRPVCK